VVTGFPYVITDSGRAYGGIDLRTTTNAGNGLYSAGISFGGSSTASAAISGIQQNADGDVQGLAFFTHGSSGSTADSAERMRITSAGGLIVGATGVEDVNSIVSQHLIEGNSTLSGVAPTGIYSNSGTANVPVLNILNRDESTNSTCRFIQFYASVTNAGAVPMGGIVGNGASNVQFASLSDIREKENVKTINGSLDKISKLNPVEFDWKKTGEHIKAGFIAQEVENIFPEYVVENISNEGEDERKGLTGGMTSGIVAHLVKSIQELKADNDSLKARIETLENN
jgi:hypothetical protein